MAAAWREISEETTLNPGSLTLLRQGKSYSFSDASVKREWTIYPFLFRLKTPADEQRITIDWEHEDWGWHDPDQVIKDETYATKGVPRLAESLRRVWFETDLGPEAGDVLSKALNTLAHDHESGARQLADIALQTLRDIIPLLPSSHPEQWWHHLRTAAWHLSKNGRESMGAAITSALLSALAQLEPLVLRQSTSGQSRGPTAAHLQSPIPTTQILSNLTDILASRKESSIASISTAFQSLLSTTAVPAPAPAPGSSESASRLVSILTLSESSTISQVLISSIPSSPNLAVNLYILESRPLFEGVSLASSLLRSPLFSESESESESKSNDRPLHKITILPDTSPALARSSSGLQIVLIGADRISSSGAVLNKMGSLPAILTAKFLNPDVKVVVLGETGKIAPPSGPVVGGREESDGVPPSDSEEENDPTQVTRAWEAEYNSERVRRGAAELIGRNKNDDSESDGSKTARTVLEIRNVFFEWVPASLVDVYVTEKGVWSTKEIREHAERLGEEEQRLFGGL